MELSLCKFNTASEANKYCCRNTSNCFTKYLLRIIEFLWVCFFVMMNFWQNSCSLRSVSRALVLNLIIQDVKGTCPQFPVWQFKLQLYKNQVHLFSSCIIHLLQEKLWISHLPPSFLWGNEWQNNRWDMVCEVQYQQYKGKICFLCLGMVSPTGKLKNEFGDPWAAIAMLFPLYE